MKISKYVKTDLDIFRRECNFTADELRFFNLRAKDYTLEEIAEMMNVSIGKTNKLSRAVRVKMRKVSV